MLPCGAPISGPTAATYVVQIIFDDLEQSVSPRRGFQSQEFCFLLEKTLQGASYFAIPLVAATIHRLVGQASAKAT